MLLKRYSSIDYVMDLDVVDGIELIKKCFEKERKDKVWDMWISLYPSFNQENFVSFEDFYKERTENTTTKQDNRTKEEILEMAEKIRMYDKN